MTRNRIQPGDVTWADQVIEILGGKLYVVGGRHEGHVEIVSRFVPNGQDPGEDPFTELRENAMTELMVHAFVTDHEPKPRDWSN